MMMNNVSNDTEQEVVSRGAELLDKKMPGWYNRIDLNSLNLNDPVKCVLGQLFDEPQTIPYWAVLGYSSAPQAMCFSERSEEYWNRPVCCANYRLGQAVLGIGKDGRDYGFDTDGVETNWAGLEFAWICEIEERQIVNG